MPLSYKQMSNVNRGRKNKHNQDSKYLIEGENLTIPEIAKRLELDPSTVRKRYQREIKLDGPVMLTNLLLTDAERRAKG